MPSKQHSPHVAALSLCLFLLPALPVGHAQSMQAPADQKAYKAARNTADPDAALTALHQFLHDFPDSKRVDDAHTAILQLLLANHGDRKREIYSEAKFLVSHAKAGEDRWNQENAVAYALAEAPPNGADLRSAEGWVQDALRGSTEAKLGASMTASALKYKAPPPNPAEIHGYYATGRAGVLQTLAEVFFHEGKMAASTSTLDEAAALDPHSGFVFTTRGQIALAGHREADALNDFELAQVYGGLTPALDPTLQRLYAEIHGGSGKSLDAEIDDRYRQLSPSPFTPAAHVTPAAGHTALLELFSGSGCEPCIGADLAVDGIVKAYPRDQAVVLVYDIHAPLPDPLANPDGVARSRFYSIPGTPTLFLDGQSVDAVYGTREEAGKRYSAIASSLDGELAKSSAVQIDLELNQVENPEVAAKATVVIDSAKLEAQQAAFAAAAARAVASGRSGAVSTSPSATLTTPSGLVLNFALVQKEIRYTGENGIRFHPMVVRALAKPSATGYPLAENGSATVTATFDLVTIRKGLSDYLQEFAKHNDRFGPVTFHKVDTSLPIDDLGVAAWVEDPATHHIFQATFLPLLAEKQVATK